MRTIQSSVCIVGAGPAGATASLFLTQYKIPHVLADRADFPRDKVCGEAFSGRVSHVLKELGIDYKDLITQNILQETRRVLITSQPENKQIEYHYPKHSTPILKGKRSVFDNFLNEKAQASQFTTYLPNMHLNKFEQQEDGIQLTSDCGQVQIKAQIVLFCTGERVNFLHHVVGEAYPTKGNTILVYRQYFKNITYEKGDAACEAHIYTKPCNYYIIINPLPDDLSLVEVAMTKKDFHEHHINFNTFFKDAIQSSDSLQARFLYATPLEKAKGTSMSLGKNPRLLSAERMLFVGSAAGSIHPFTGFGVGHAMRMAQIAAFQAAQSVQKTDFSAKTLKKYDKAVRSRMQSDFLVSSVVCIVTFQFQFLMCRVLFSWIVRSFMLFLKNRAEVNVA
jgi:flavin-dependent dehydrogenase